MSCWRARRSCAAYSESTSSSSGLSAVLISSAPYQAPLRKSIYYGRDTGDLLPLLSTMRCGLPSSRPS